MQYDLNMKLSENFTLKEFWASDTAIQKGINNELTEEAVVNLKHLCTEVLQPFRKFVAEKYKAKKIAIIITSGYRCPELNTAVGGSKTSSHMKGEAADVKVLIDGVYLQKTQMQNDFKQSGLPIDQCIIYKSKGIMHLGYRSRIANRNEYLFLK